MFIRNLAWSLLVLAALALVAPRAPQARDQKPPDGPATLQDYDVSDLPVGGPISLTDQDGKPFRLTQLHGKVVMLFFGYTFCPDVCPLSLSKITHVKESLGADGKAMQPVFITIDPARDTPARMKSFVDNFPGNAMGLTGSAAEIAQVAARYKAKYKRGEAHSKTDYLMAHTAYLYMLDRQGKVRYMFPPDVDDAVLETGIRWLAVH